MSEASPFSETVRALAAAERGDRHPAPEILLAYHGQRLDEVEHDAVQGHLAACPACTEFVLEIGRSEEAGASTDPEVERALAAIHERLGAMGRPPTTARRWPVLLPLAALFAFAALGLGAFVVQQAARLDVQQGQITALEAELAALPKPDHSFEIVSLQPADELVRGARPPVIDGPVLLVLNHLATGADVEYRAELRTASGQKVWSWNGMRPTAIGNFTVELPASLRHPGRYKIDLYRLDATPKLEASFELELVDELAN